MQVFDMQMIDRKKRDNGFTLIELMVVIMIISLLAGIAVPSAVRLFSSSADTQAYNLFNAQLSYARAVAIENQTYAGLHSQMADNDSPAVKRLKLEDKCVTAVLGYNTSTNFFEIVKGTTPKPLPAKMAFGNVSDYISGNVYSISNNTTALESFTNLTLVFNSDGEIVTSVPDGGGGNLSNIFTASDAAIDTSKSNYIWGNNTLNTTTAVTLINYKEAGEAIKQDTLKNYLDENAQFLPVNIYTGRMLPRE